MAARLTRKPALRIGACVAILAAAGYLCFELGRYQAGYSVLDERRRTERYESAIAQRDAQLDELRHREAVLETSLEIDRETYARVEDSLGQLQAEIQAQEEELAFYRGIVAPEDGVAGLRIQNLEIRTADAERRHRVRLVLVQAIVHSEPASGVVQLTLAGRLDGETAEYRLEELVSDEEAGTLAYDFRYFQSFEREVVLPAGFEPGTVEVRVEPAGSQDAFTQRFDWSAVAG